MGRIMAIDYGQKRTGLAVTDPLQFFATGLDTISTHELIIFLKSYCEKNDVDEFVVGNPVQMNNKPSESVVFIKPFLKLLQKTFPEKKLTSFDERFTSKMASQAILESGVNKKTRSDKALIDKVSATILLQSYLVFIK